MKENLFACVPEEDPAQPEESAQQQPLGYYYDDGTGYEIFNPDEEDDDEHPANKAREDESAAVEDEAL